MNYASALRLVPALRHRNYRLFFAGQSISLAGTWLTRFATVWMVYRLTRSPVMLGLVGFFGQAPAAVLAPIAGVLVDRWNRRRTIIVTQVASMLQSATLAAFALSGTMTVWHLLVLGAVQAVINAFDMVARQSFLSEMIEDRANLPNAVALNSLMVNSARMLGPVAAAALVALVGEGYCFAVDALSSLPVIASLFAMRVPERVIPRRAGHAIEEMREALTYVAGLPMVRAVLLLFAAVSLLGQSYTTLLPLFAGETLHGGPHTLGVLMGAAGLGALTGALLLAGHTGRAAQRQAPPTEAEGSSPAARPTTLGSGRVLAACTLVLGAGLVLLELARSTLVAAPILFVIGACLMVQTTSASTVVQTDVAPDKIGRVLGLVAIAFFGGMPVGSLLQGQLAKLVGPVHTFAIAGVGCIAAGLAFTRALSRLHAPAPLPSLTEPRSSP